MRIKWRESYLHHVYSLESFCVYRRILSNISSQNSRAHVSQERTGRDAKITAMHLREMICLVSNETRTICMILFQAPLKANLTLENSVSCHFPSNLEISWFFYERPPPSGMVYLTEVWKHINQSNDKHGSCHLHFLSALFIYPTCEHVLIMSRLISEMPFENGDLSTGDRGAGLDWILTPRCAPLNIFYRKWMLLNCVKYPFKTLLSRARPM